MNCMAAIQMTNGNYWTTPLGRKHRKYSDHAQASGPACNVTHSLARRAFIAHENSVVPIDP
jgi:hypothetical protein